MFDLDLGIVDDKVSVVPVSKIMSLDGGGEDSTAYILLYRSKVV
jgi:ubiquitin carboxyl-terminal hydrolase 14